MSILDYDEPPETKEPYCKCGLPDMPGTCPGWRSCEMVEHVNEEDDE